MKKSTESFKNLDARLRAGHESAAEQIVCNYLRRLIGLARNRLPVEIACKDGPEDAVQSALASFFERYKGGEFDNVANWDDLWTLMAHITAMRCNKRVERYFSQCRDVSREFQAAAAGDESDQPFDVVDIEPTALDLLMLIEVEERLFQGCLPADITILKLSLSGDSVAEIAEKIGYSQRHVQRARGRFRKILMRMLNEWQ